MARWPLCFFRLRPCKSLWCRSDFHTRFSPDSTKAKIDVCKELHVNKLQSSASKLVTYSNFLKFESGFLIITGAPGTYTRDRGHRAWFEIKANGIVGALLAAVTASATAARTRAYCWAQNNFKMYTLLVTIGLCYKQYHLPQKHTFLMVRRPSCLCCQRSCGPGGVTVKVASRDPGPGRVAGLVWITGRHGRDQWWRWWGR